MPCCVAFEEFDFGPCRPPVPKGSHLLLTYPNLFPCLICAGGNLHTKASTCSNVRPASQSEFVFLNFPSRRYHLASDIQGRIWMQFHPQTIFPNLLCSIPCWEGKKIIFHPPFPTNQRIRQTWPRLRPKRPRLGRPLPLLNATKRQWEPSGSSGSSQF